MPESEPIVTVNASPLSGLHVVEYGIWHAGPGGSAILGDLGADVIKVEAFGGDPERRYGAFGDLQFPQNDSEWNVLFDATNRNKRSLALDITNPAGYETFIALIKTADVFLTNLRREPIVELALDYASLATFNPRLIHASVSGFGPHGALANDGAFDHMGQARSGMMYLVGHDEPRPLSTLVLDQLTSITVSHAILAALHERHRTGLGQEVSTSLYGAALWLIHVDLLASSVHGRDIDTAWIRAENPPTRSTFRCGDGRWLSAANQPEHIWFAPLCAAVGLPELAQDPRFDSDASRRANMAELYAILDERLLTRSSGEWLKMFKDNNLKFGIVNSFVDALADDQALVNGYIQECDHPRLGSLHVPGYPAEFGAGFSGFRSSAPALGEHTAEILRECGFADDDVRKLADQGVIRHRNEQPG